MVVDSLYNVSRSDTVLPLDLSKAMADAMEALYRQHSTPGELVPKELFRGIADTLDRAIPDELTAGYPELDRRIRLNNEVFAAFKVHDQCARMAELLTDEDGNLKSFSQWCKEAGPIASHHNRVWLRTEYETAAKRASQALQWKQFEAERSILPNLRWVPSTAATPSADHQCYWNTVRPIDDPFWSAHRPGDRWGCQCGLEATDEPATRLPDKDNGNGDDNPAPGLGGNPAKDGKLFDLTHPYFPVSCGSCPFNTGTKGTTTPRNRLRDCPACEFFNAAVHAGDTVREANIRVYEQYRTNRYYRDVRFDDETNGVMAVHVSHKKANSNERKVLDGLSGMELEVKCMETVCRKGGTCILESEKRRVNEQWTSCLDATIQGESMDIASVTENGRNTIYNTICRKEIQMIKYNSLFNGNAHSLAMYFHNPALFPGKDKILAELERYTGNSHYKGLINTVYCIVNDGSGDMIVVKTGKD